MLCVFSQQDKITGLHIVVLQEKAQLTLEESPLNKDGRTEFPNTGDTS